ncbi:hypothetical protein [Sorangium sp. So ce887]|uniref:hypothetical protein n=1 Tax=Sorangium sp. So ce887 TaxID=3133324 RepID=UPI003F6367A9
MILDGRREDTLPAPRAQAWHAQPPREHHATIRHLQLAGNVPVELYVRAAVHAG